MKQSSDYFTRDFLGNKPGRPRTASTKTGAQRQREYRQRKMSISVTSDEKDSCAWCGAARSNSCGLCNVGQLGHV